MTYALLNYLLRDFITTADNLRCTAVIEDAVDFDLFIMDTAVMSSDDTVTKRSIVSDDLQWLAWYIASISTYPKGAVRAYEGPDYGLGFIYSAIHNNRIEKFSDTYSTIYVIEDDKQPIYLLRKDVHPDSGAFYKYIWSTKLPQWRRYGKGLHPIGINRGVS